MVLHYMSRRTKIIILAILVLILLGVFLLWLYGRSSSALPASRQGSSSPPLTTSTSATVQNTPLGSVGSTIDRTTNPQIARAGVEAVARSFTERYGSYSNQSNFQNIEDLYPFMTASMRVSAEAFVAGERARQSSDALSYSGITTKVLNVKVLSQSATDARLVLTTQRTESKTGVAPRVYYQDAELVMKYARSQWNAGALVWK